MSKVKKPGKEVLWDVLKSYVENIKGKAEEDNLGFLSVLSAMNTDEMYKSVYKGEIRSNVNMLKGLLDQNSMTIIHFHSITDMSCTAVDVFQGVGKHVIDKLISKELEVDDINELISKELEIGDIEERSDEQKGIAAGIAVISKVIQDKKAKPANPVQTHAASNGTDTNGYVRQQANATTSTGKWKKREQTNGHGNDEIGI